MRGYAKRRRNRYYRIIFKCLIFSASHVDSPIGEEIFPLIEENSMSSTSSVSSVSSSAAAISKAASLYTQRVLGSSATTKAAVASSNPANDSATHEAKEPHSETVDEASGGDSKARVKLAKHENKQSVKDSAPTEMNASIIETVGSQHTDSAIGNTIDLAA